jgi:hypothetical protein
MVSTAPQRRRRLPLRRLGRRMGRRQSKGRERAAYRTCTLNALGRHCVVVLCNLLLDYN